MRNGKNYTIPHFQRDYSWEEQQLDELWQDIEQMLDSKIQHFMGYIVFQTSRLAKQASAVWQILSQGF